MKRTQQPPVRGHRVREHRREMAYWWHDRPFLISVAHQFYFCEVCICLRGFTVMHVYTILECSAVISLFIGSNQINHQVTPAIANINHWISLFKRKWILIPRITRGLMTWLRTEVLEKHEFVCAKCVQYYSKITVLCITNTPFKLRNLLIQVKVIYLNLLLQRCYQVQSIKTALCVSVANNSLK